MTYRSIVAGLVALVAAVVLLRGALFETNSPPTIGILHPSNVHTAAVNGFKSAMAEAGYVEGEDVLYLYDGPTGPGPAVAERAQALVESGVDLIYAASTPATREALRAAEAAGIEIVFGPVNNPLGAGFVESLRAPGGLATGVTLAPSTGRRLAWFKEFDAEIRVILVPYNPEDASSRSSLGRVQAVAETLGFEIDARPVTSPAELRVLMAALPETAEGIFLPRDSMINAQIAEIVPAAIARKLPLSGPGYNQVAKGALFGYGVRQGSVGRTAARLALQILSGTPPAVIPVETEDSHLFINTETAAALGLSLTPELLSQAQTLLP